MGIKIQYLDEGDPAVLYRHFQGQTSPQPVIVELLIDETGQEDVIRITWDGEIGGAVPGRIWHGLDRRYVVSGIPTARGANRLLDAIAPLAQRVVDEWDSYYEGGGNWRGRVTEEGEEAEDDIREMCHESWEVDEQVQAYDAEEYLADLDDGDLDITSTTSDDELEKMAEKMEEEAREDGIHILEGVYRYLCRMRERAIEKAEEAEEAEAAEEAEEVVDAEA